VQGAVSVAGKIDAVNYNFSSTISDAPETQWSQFWGCHFTAPGFTLGGTANTRLRLFQCNFDTAVTFTGTVQRAVEFDSETAAQILGFGGTAAGAAPPTTRTYKNQNSSITTITNNVGGVTVCQTPLAGMYRLDASLVLLAQGTSGLPVVNVLYTDLTGSAKSKTITTAINIATDPVGTEQTGSFVFQPKAGTLIQFQIAGIVTPGAVQIAQGITITRCD